MLCFACFGAANAQQALPYSYGFENNNLATDGWTAQITSTSSGINSNAAHTGSYGFRFNYSETAGYLVSPLLTGGDRGVDVSFWYKEYSSSYGDEQFYVGYTTDESATDPTRFTYGDIVTASTSWQEYVYSFPAGTKRIAIQYVYNDAFYLYLDDFVFEAKSSCARPTDVEVTYEGGTTATVSWRGEARSYNIDVNGEVIQGVASSPYTLRDLEPATVYTVMVQADCGEEQSGWVTADSFFTDCDVASLPFFCGFESEAEYNCWTMANTANSTGLASGSDYVHDGTYSFVFAYNTNPPQYLISPEFEGTSAMLVSFFYKIRSTNYPETFQVGYSTTTNATDAFTWETEVTATNAGEWLEYETTFPNGTKFVAVRYNSNDMYYLFLDDFNFEVATGCLKPSNLEANEVGTNSAVLSWTGDNNSYVLQYRTAAHDNMNEWEQVGNDIIGTGTLTQYSFDLSSYSGTGNIAIRHYNVSDMFRVAIDDIVVTDANGTEVINEGFESSVPSDWQGLDYDGDGNGWARVSFSDEGYQNGDYCMSSESWQSGVGALTPDNWLIIPDVELGGTLTFYMRGVDPSFPQENIGVFVTTASLDVVFSITPAGEWSADITTTDTEYELTGLTANTEYEWQVKGICDNAESNWASSSFTTIAEGFKTFITAGNWDEDANWFPAGVPAITDEVSIEADAIIPAGVVATAKRVDLNGGSILIKDGGQLKQGAATLRVTMEKEITGYGSGNGNYYFISSPFSGRTLYEESGTWSRVDNMLTGNYDLYAFDATAEDGLEWINYKSSPTHISFQSDNGNAGLMYGEGYLYANQDGTTLRFVGTTGKSIDYTEAIDYTYDGESTDDWNGWKLVGNYFSCNGYISYIDANGEVLDADFYTLNNNNTYSLMSSGQPLPPCTGALINYSATGKVQYSTEAPEAKNSGMLNMTVTKDRSNVDQARIRFGQGYNLAKVSFRNSSKLYIQQNGNDYAVVRGEAQGEMPVSFKAESNGTYTLSFNNTDVEFGYLHLIDNLTGNDVDLLVNPSYSFEAKTTDYASRFRLVFATGNTSDDNFAYYSDGTLVINNEGNATMNVYDVTGRLVNTQSVNGSCQVKLNTTAGVYMIQLVNGESTKTQKIVVK